MKVSEQFQRLYKLTTITKFQDFHYRLLHNVIFTNNRLYYWKIVESKKCEYCVEESQTPMHLLFQCPQAQTLWKQFKKFLIDCTGVERSQLCFTENSIKYNSVYYQLDHTINLMVLIIKAVYICLQMSTNYDRLQHYNI